MFTPRKEEKKKNTEIVFVSLVFLYLYLLYFSVTVLPFHAGTWRCVVCCSARLMEQNLEYQTPPHRHTIVAAACLLLCSGVK